MQLIIGAVALTGVAANSFCAAIAYSRGLEIEQYLWGLGVCAIVTAGVMYSLTRLEYD